MDEVMFSTYGALAQHTMSMLGGPCNDYNEFHSSGTYDLQISHEFCSLQFTKFYKVCIFGQNYGE